ncbi:MAG: ferritin-like protein [Actinomycetia bacterium]|nr:ferritin-like protein [Actinomycetes bacterium]
MGFNSLQDVFAEQLNDLRSAEQQLVQALPRMAGAASSEQLREAFEEHLAQTRGHLERIEDLLATSGVARTDEVCVGMRGLIEEGSKVVSASGDPVAKDAALIAAAQRVEHYEIAAYGTAATLANQLDLDEAPGVLGQTLDEEEAADKVLTKIATGGMFHAGVNQQAAR